MDSNFNNEINKTCQNFFQAANYFNEALKLSNFSINEIRYTLNFKQNKEINLDNFSFHDIQILYTKSRILTSNNSYYNLTYLPAINSFLEILEFFLLKGDMQPINKFQAFKNEFMPALNFNNLFDFINDLIMKVSNIKVLQTAYTIKSLIEYEEKKENKEKKRKINKALLLTFSLFSKAPKIR